MGRRYQRGVLYFWVMITLAMGVSARAEDAAQPLKARASAFWDAQVRGDWATVYGFLPAEETAHTTREQFASFRKEKGPFRYLSAQVGQVTVAGDLGWVEVTHESQPQGYPTLPPKHLHIWDLWRKREGQWSPVPKAQIGQWPKLPPQLRPAEEEAALAKRAQELWKVTERGDGAGMYQYLEPGFQSRVPLEQFLKKKPRYLYLSHRFEWVEVIKDHGRVKVAYTTKLNDPSLTKMDPQDHETIEDWIKIDNQWYRQVREPNN